MSSVKTLAGARRITVRPQVITGAASKRTIRGANVSGTVHPRGRKITAYFEYGTSTRMRGRSRRFTMRAKKKKKVTVGLAGFSAESTVYYRLVVLAGGRKYVGARRTFLTQPAPVRPPDDPKKPDEISPPPKPPEVPILSKRQAEAYRLLWRAGCGPGPGEVDAYAALSREQAVHRLTRPTDAAVLGGAAPVDDKGQPIAPYDAWGHDHMWWMDRMIRSNQSMGERMALVWHDWFATSNEKVGNQRMMIEQIDLFRVGAFGSFADMMQAVTVNPAMLVGLDGIDNHRWAPNENFARELMELFTLGANRGAYTEQDVREAARALTGWRADWVEGQGLVNFRYDNNRHDNNNKTIFGKTGNWGVADVVRMCIEHPLHASYFVTKMRSYFIPTRPSQARIDELSSLYKSSGYSIRAVVESILLEEEFYTGPGMVQPPAIYNVAMLRTTRQTININWEWIARGSGQRLFLPPDVSGWDETRWLDTSTFQGRWNTATYALRKLALDPAGSYSHLETPAEAVNKAINFCGKPRLTQATFERLLAFAGNVPYGWNDAATSRQWIMRQNALRHLIFTSPDYYTP